MTASYEGGCACGAVRYRISAEPLVAGHCQCRDCQRITGTGHASMIGFPEAAVQITGVLKFHAVKADSGSTASRGFCPECGAFVAARSSGMPGMMTIAAGSLDEPERFAPQMAVYTKSGNAWDHLDPALPRFAAMPDVAPAAT
jgi:hypothetical protein